MNSKVLKISLGIFLYSLCGYAQGTSLNASFDEALNLYRTKNRTEKIFVHTDKEFYLAGEIIWFKVYYVDGTLHTPESISKLAYVEVLDKDQKPVLQGKIALTDGSGSGSFYLPVSLASGVYQFRAYTQWMKNGLPDYFFQKLFTIVNSTRTLVSPATSMPKYHVGFFPEGGHLVQNVQSKIAFRITDSTGLGVNCQGVIVNQNQDTILTFRTSKFGIGNFLLTPKAGDSYRSEIRLKDTILLKSIPDANEEGYVMNLSKHDGTGQLRIGVTGSSRTSGTVHLIVHAQNGIRLTEQRTLKNNLAEFIIDRNIIAEGITYFTLLDNEKQPVCERLYFIRPRKKLLIETNPLAKEFSKRDRVEVNLTTKDETGKPTTADLSVSVYKLNGNHSFDGIDINSYFWLSSELRGRVESPAYYFSDTTAEAEVAADNLMLTHGWRQFVWKDILASKNLPVEFLPEYDGHIIHAKVTDTRTGLPVRGVLTYLSVPGRRVQLYTSESDSAGRLKFYTTDFYGFNEILLQTANQSDTSYKIEIISPFSEKYASAEIIALQLREELKQPLMEQNVGVQVQNVFTADKLNQLYSPAIDSNAFYGPPDNSYLLDQYVRFSTMEEVLREYVVEVLVRRQKENFRLMISGGLDNRIFLDDPLTLFNGVPVLQTNKVMQYDPLKVERVDVVRRRYFYGPSVMNGIVNFTTYQPDPVMLSALNAVAFDYEGMQLEREFYSPAYETPEELASRMPDFRNVLFWSPHISSTASSGTGSFNFYTSDQKGNYLVVVQGIDKSGRAGIHYSSFSVR